MKKDQFYQYLNFSDQLNSESLVELRDLVNEYPYFQAARMLYVKNLKNEENILFNKQLKYAAACINNRQLLFGLLNSIHISNEGSFLPDQDFGSDEGLLSLAEEDHGQETSSGSRDGISKYDKSIYVQKLERFIPIADLDLLLIDFPLSDNDILDFDFDDQLPDITDDNTKHRNEIPDQQDKSGGLSSKDLISDFIRKNPRMPQLAESGHSPNDISLQSLKESDAFMTETLAEIYVKQGYYYRALQAYEKLSLKNPEKSIYFATRIQKIKELITNQ